MLENSALEYLIRVSIYASTFPKKILVQPERKKMLHRNTRTTETSHKDSDKLLEKKVTRTSKNLWC
jgi:hypothetical protein